MFKTKVDFNQNNNNLISFETKKSNYRLAEFA